MIEVVVDSVRASLMTNHRMVILRETDQGRYLPIWIGTFEAEAITIELLGRSAPRPLTHDLLKAIIGAMNGRVSHILINDLREDTFFARIVIDQNGKKVEIDARPSDAIALAVRVKASVFVADSVMDQAGILPEEGVGELVEDRSSASEGDLSAFRDFVESLDMDDLSSE